MLFRGWSFTVTDKYLAFHIDVAVTLSMHLYLPDLKKLKNVGVTKLGPHQTTC